VGAITISIAAKRRRGSALLLLPGMDHSVFVAHSAPAYCCFDWQQLPMGQTELEFDRV
jgi:hypothetical protein